MDEQRPADSSCTTTNYREGPIPGAKEAVDKITEEPAVKAPPASPASLGMALTSTIIGPNGGIARIGGRTYNQGQTIEAVKEGRNYKFVLSEIHDRKVVLELEGESSN